MQLPIFLMQVNKDYIILPHALNASNQCVQTFLEGRVYSMDNLLKSIFGFYLPVLGENEQQDKEQ